MDTLPEVETLKSRLTAGDSVVLRLSQGGHLYIDRPLPFLCLYRRPPDQDDDVTQRLVSAQASYMIASGDPADHAEVQAVIDEIATEMIGTFGAFLVLEVWRRAEGTEPEKNQAYNLQPRFRIVAEEGAELEESTAELATALKRVTVHEHIAEVAVSCTERVSHTGLQPIEASHPHQRIVGIEVTPVYLNEPKDEVYPVLFNTLRQQFTTALKHCLFSFSASLTSLGAPSYLALGRRAFEQAVTQVDEGLARIDESFDFLLQTTPVNANEAWAEFSESNCERDPIFRYRPLPVDPELLKRRLFELPIENVEDPSLNWLFREKQEELDQRITMLRERNTRKFFFESLQLYGEVRPELLSEAETILEHLPVHDYDMESAENLDAEAFAEIAVTEFLYYRRTCEEFPETVHIRHDMPPGLMVSQGRLLMGYRTKVPAPRMNALLHHEIGTHMLTYYNGRAQPLRLLYNGLAGYESLQEGIAVLSEYLAGGLNVPRLRVLAARVVAAHRMIDGSTFVDLYRLLRQEHGFEKNEAFSITMRTFRGGGLIKDVIYLRGLHELLSYLREGGDLDPLFVGKIGLHHLPFVRELYDRGVLVPPLLHPRYLEDAEVPARLDRIKEGLTFLDLIQRKHG